MVVPVYNGAAHLAETIDSLLTQTFTDFEILLVDDGSTDNSVAILERYTDPRIRIIRKESRSGLCDTVNRGIAEAKAPFVARNDQDDLSRPERLARELAAMQQQPDALALFCFYSKVASRHEWSNSDKLRMVPGQVRPYSPESDGCLLSSTMLARTDALRAIGGFRQEYYPTDDWDIQLRLLERGKVLILQEPLVVYRFHSGASTYQTFFRMQQTSRWAFDSHRRRLRHEPELSFDDYLRTQDSGAWARFRRSRFAFAKLHMRLAGQHYLDGSYLRGAGHLLLAFLLHPPDLFERIGRLLRLKS